MKNKYKCKTCFKEFLSSYSFQNYCNPICKKNYYKTIRPDSLVKTGLPSGTVGAMVELLVGAELIKKGYEVFRALSPSSFCDLIIVKNKRTLKVEVKTCWRQKNGRFIFPRKKFSDKKVIFALWDKLTGEINYLDSIKLEKVKI